MDYVGVVTLIHPAVFCLLIGTSMLVTGVSWLLVCRHHERKMAKIISAVLIFVISCAIFAITIYLKYGLLPVYFETISAL